MTELAISIKKTKLTQFGHVITQLTITQLTISFKDDPRHLLHLLSPLDTYKPQLSYHYNNPQPLTKIFKIL